VALALFVGPLIIAAILRLFGVESITLRLEGGFPPSSFQFGVNGTGLLLLAVSVVGFIWVIVIVIRRNIGRQ
jgi:hypothetical protein